MNFDSHESTSGSRSREESKLGRGALTFVVGMQFGSEAKGSIVQYFAPGASNVVRTGAVNAGHTIHHHGEVHVMKQIPSAWINPHAKLVIGAGALISPDTLRDEMERLQPYGIQDRLLIDQNAHIIVPEQIEDEATMNLGERIGSTSSRSRKGIGVAMADKVLRSLRCVQVKDYKPLQPYVTDTVDYLNDQLDQGRDVLVEGTQGYGLSIDHGEFPYTTSINATVSGLASSIGVQPAAFDTHVIGVTRTFPIRVAGNSGPFAEGSEELTWDEMRELSGNPNLMTEHTTVTRLPRRIATFSDKQYMDACKVNRPTEIALTFADYLDWKMYNAETVDTTDSDSALNLFINHLEELYPDALVTLVNTGPTSTIDFDAERRARLQQLRANII